MTRHGLVRKIVQRKVHAVTFGGAVAAAALIDAADRTGVRTNLLGALMTDVVVAGNSAESVGAFIERSVPALWADTGGSAELAALVTAELVRRRRQFVARGVRFALQGDVVLIDDVAPIRLDSGVAAVLRVLADHPGATLSRHTLARMSALSLGTRANGSDIAVSRLRLALGEHRWLVATASRRGYRLAVD